MIQQNSAKYFNLRDYLNNQFLSKSKTLCFPGIPRSLNLFPASSESEKVQEKTDAKKDNDKILSSSFCVSLK